MNKKVLFVAYIFPPLGGSGVQRSLKFAKYLPLYGWSPTILTVKKNSYKYQDKSLASELPANLEIVRLDDPIINLEERSLNVILNFLFSIAKRKDLIESIISDCNNKLLPLKKIANIPDTKIMWAINSIRNIHQKINIENFDLIYTTSGPYSTNLIGYKIKEKYNIPWVSDFRDEWTNNQYLTKEYQENPSRFNLLKALEGKCLDLADKVITISDMSRDNYENKFGISKSKIDVITNGYDEKDFKDIINGKSDKFTIIHNGLFYKEHREPYNFLYALYRLIKNDFIRKECLRIVFTQNNEKLNISHFCKRLNIHEIVTQTGYLEHKESLKAASKANILLLIVGSGEEKKSVYTGKVFEYLRLMKPILALAPKEGVVDQLLTETGRGEAIEYDDIPGIEQYLLKTYNSWMSGKQTIYKNNRSIKKYERKDLTLKLASIFDSVLTEEK
ncbi:MAG: glycosyltransferase [bacterium]